MSTDFFTPLPTRQRQRRHNSPYVTLETPCKCCGSFSFIHTAGEQGTPEATYECFHCHVEKN